MTKASNILDYGFRARCFKEGDWGSQNCGPKLEERDERNEWTTSWWYCIYFTPIWMPELAVLND